jgi:hypothetical protein
MVIPPAQWRIRTDWNTVCARSSGRRHYPAARQQAARARRDQVFELLLRHGWDNFGVCAKIARELHVHRCTIVRDRQTLLREMD